MNYIHLLITLCHRKNKENLVAGAHSRKPHPTVQFLVVIHSSLDVFSDFKTHYTTNPDFGKSFAASQANHGVMAYGMYFLQEGF